MRLFHTGTSTRMMELFISDGRVLASALLTELVSSNAEAALL